MTVQVSDYLHPAQLLQGRHVHPQQKQVHLGEHEEHARGHLQQPQGVPWQPLVYLPAFHALPLAL